MMMKKHSVHKINYRPLLNSVSTKEQSELREDNFAFFFVCTKEICKLLLPASSVFFCSRLQNLKIASSYIPTNFYITQKKNFGFNEQDKLIN